MEYHPTLSLAGDLGRPTWCWTSTRRPAGPFGQAVAAAHLIGQALAGAGLAGAVKTSGSKGLHIYVPVQASGEEVAAATRAIATRAARLDPALATTAFIKEDREGKVFLDSTRAFGATVAAAYSPRVRPGVPVSFPVRWDDLDSVAPGDFTVHSVPALLGGHAAWAGELPAPQLLPPELVEEEAGDPGRPGAGHARGQAAQAGQGGAVSRGGLAGVPAVADLRPGRRRAGQLTAAVSPHAVEDERQVPVPQLGGARRVGELASRPPARTPARCRAAPGPA